MEAPESSSPIILDTWHHHPCWGSLSAFWHSWERIGIIIVYDLPIVCSCTVLLCLEKFQSKKVKPTNRWGLTLRVDDKLGHWNSTLICHTIKHESIVVINIMYCTVSNKNTMCLGVWGGACCVLPRERTLCTSVLYVTILMLKVVISSIILF